MDDPLPLPAFLGTRPAGSGGSRREGIHDFDLDRQCAPGCARFSGVHVIRDFLSESEAERLLREIEATPFVAAQSGKLKQHHGARVNFNKRKINTTGFRGLPDYVHRIGTRLRDRTANDPDLRGAAFETLRSAVGSFEPTDAFVMRYHEQDASNLDFHRDDLFAYGEVILDVSLESDSVLTFLEASERSDSRVEADCVRVPLPARSLAILHGPARFDWEHAILAYDIAGRRTSLTLRTLAESLRGIEAGREILAIARRGRPLG